MDISDKLKEKGWHLSKEGIELLLQDTNANDINALTKKALGIDLRDIGCGGLPSDIAKSKYDHIDGNIVVQVTKLRNVSAPKINQDSKRFPRLLKLTITDGKISVSALEEHHINGLSIDTPPGTKIFLKKGLIKIVNNYLFLNPENTSILGGTVPNLVEKWELERNLSKYAKGSRNATSFSKIGCPPPWVPFGKKSLEKQSSSEDAALKSIQKFMDEKSQKATAEFEALRKEKLEQALSDNKNKPTKSFGGGKKQLIDANVKRIMDAGYTQAEAENALRFTKHNADRALKNLQFRTGNQFSDTRTDRFEKRRGKRDLEETKPSSGKISLSDFLEDKLPKPVKAEPVLEKYHEIENTLNERHNYGPNQKYSQNNLGRNANRNSHFGQKYDGNNSHSRSDDRPNFYDQTKNDSNIKKYDPQPSYNSQKNIQSNIEYRRERMQNQKSYPEFNSNSISDIVDKTAMMSLSNQDTSQMRLNTYDKKPRKEQAPLSYDVKPPAFKTKFNNIKGFQHKHTDDSMHQPINTATFSNRKTEVRNPQEWKWFIGDRCLAKYWEDKKYYDAEITGVSERTCVVRFLEYGNFEEINKTDCLPIENQFNNQPAKYGHAPQNAPRLPNSNNDKKQPPPPFSKKHENGGHTQAHRNKPLRNSQSIYVPPAQRN